MNIARYSSSLLFSLDPTPSKNAPFVIIKRFFLSDSLCHANYYWPVLETAISDLVRRDSLVNHFRLNNTIKSINPAFLKRLEDLVHGDRIGKQMI